MHSYILRISRELWKREEWSAFSFMTHRRPSEIPRLRGSWTASRPKSQKMAPGHAWNRDQIPFCARTTPLKRDEASHVERQTISCIPPDSRRIPQTPSFPLISPHPVAYRVPPAPPILQGPGTIPFLPSARGKLPGMVRPRTGARPIP